MIPWAELPELADERLRLRSWRAGDAESLHAAWHDEVVLAGSSPPADRSLAAATRWIAGAAQRRDGGVALDLVIASATDDGCLGEVGLSRVDARRRAAIVGWWVGEAHRGAGLATAAVSLLADWVVHPKRLHALVAEIGGDNAASERVAAAAGFECRRPALPDAPGVWVRQLV